MCPAPIKKLAVTSQLLKIAGNNPGNHNHKLGFKQVKLTPFSNGKPN